MDARTMDGGGGRGERRRPRFAPALLLALGACAATPSPVRPPATPAAAVEASIAADLIAALVQQRPPRTTTVQLGFEADPGLDALADRLAEAGYGIQRVEADRGADRLAWRRSPGRDANGTAIEHVELAVGAVRIARAYRRGPNGPTPAGPLRIGGGGRAATPRPGRVGADAGQGAAFVPVARLIVSFTGASTTLDVAAKARVARFVAGYREASDRVALIGCDAAPEAARAGARGPAPARAARIVDELLALGVPRGDIVGRRCALAGDPVAPDAERSVIVELRRSAS